MRSQWYRKGSRASQLLWRLLDDCLGSLSSDGIGNVLSHVSLFVILWTVAHQAPLSMEFSENTRVGHHFLLQGIFPTQGPNSGLLYWQADSLPLSHLGSPLIRLPRCLMGQDSEHTHQPWEYS